MADQPWDRIREADEAAGEAAKAFSSGRFDLYWQEMARDVVRRLRDQALNVGEADEQRD